MIYIFEKDSLKNNFNNLLKFSIVNYIIVKNQIRLSWSVSLTPSVTSQRYPQRTGYGYSKLSLSDNENVSIITINTCQ